MNQLDRLEALADRSQRAPGHIEAHDRIDLWICDACGFGFDAVHQDATVGGEDGIYTCPCCLEAAVWPLLPDLIRVAQAAKAYRTEWTRSGPEANFSRIRVSGQQLDDALAALYREVES